ncbi:hypothetical protein Q428_02835 [Fervidicella metallireducens AeB]|uniref:Amidohydrolase 3 domain-containing protein n=1 Tax=Fervidicella metallireducens AeB TaxID=1403537 RepID=A0A017RXA6_9CLOT|nr:amidohydrolase [Fervidicella metallireducens]EYE89413.1 hypothetical protein Q428_02835 [Fervidicella metallireducens AeB]
MAEIALINGKVFSMNSKDETYEAVGISEGKIKLTGTTIDVLNNMTNPEVIDLNGKIVLPGFFESHIHFLDFARTLIDLDLKNIKNREEFEDVLSAYSKGLPKDEWILGFGWNEAYLFDGIMPSRELLDGIVQNKPVCLIKQDGHAVILNSCALNILKLDKFKNTFSDEKAPRDSDENYTGLFYEDLVFKILGMITEKLSDVYFKTALKRADYQLISNGITMINDIMTQYPVIYNIYRTMHQKGELNVRIKAGALGGSKEYDEFMNLKGDEFLSVGPVKYFMDGSFGSRTALLFEDYEDDIGNKGMQNITDDKLYEIIEDSLKNNIQIAIHAIGDKAVNKVLNVYEDVFSKYPNKEVRNRIEHIQIIKEEDIDRFKKLGIVASYQPVFNLESTLTINRIGMRRIKDSYRFRTFIEKDIPVIFNSDCPYGSEYLRKKDGTYFKGFEPMIGLHCAANELNLNRREVVPINEAVRCFTFWPAFANHLEDKLGTVEIGKLADLVVLDRDIFEIDKCELKDTNVEMTIINGKIVYKKD